MSPGRGQIVQHVGGEREAGGVAVQDRLMKEILRDHRFADAVRTDQHDIGRLLDEVQGEELFDQRPVALGRPAPVEADHRIVLLEPDGLQTSAQAAPRALGFLDLQQLRQPRLVDDGLDVGEQPVQAEVEQALAQVLKVQRWVRRVRVHRSAPW
jgi:hypothetical protein